MTTATARLQLQLDYSRQAGQARWSCMRPARPSLISPRSWGASQKRCPPHSRPPRLISPRPLLSLVSSRLHHIINIISSPLVSSLLSPRLSLVSSLPAPLAPSTVHRQLAHPPITSLLPCPLPLPAAHHQSSLALPSACARRLLAARPAPFISMWPVAFAHRASSARRSSACT